MLGRTYSDQICSIARTLEVVGERWTLLIVRDVFLGLHRFEEFQESLGIARNVLTDRLARLVDSGILSRDRYQKRPDRYEYRITAKGKELFVALLALMHWGDRLAAGEARPPRLATHAGCGGPVTELVRCAECGEFVGPDGVNLIPGPALEGI